MHQFRWLSERGGLPFKFDSERGGTQKGDLPSEKGGWGGVPTLEETMENIFLICCIT